MYKELESSANQPYWEDVRTIVLDELGKLRRLAAPDARRDGVHQAVAEDVTQVLTNYPPYWRILSPQHPWIRPCTCCVPFYMYINVPLQIFKGKTGAQLEALQTQIEQKISGRRDGVDVGYWESLLSQLKAHMARARLRDRHQHNLRRKLQLLKQEQGVQPPPADANHKAPQPQ